MELDEIANIAREVRDEFQLRALRVERLGSLDSGRWSVQFTLESGPHSREIGVDLAQLKMARDPVAMLRDILRGAAADFAKHAANVTPAR